MAANVGRTDQLIRMFLGIPLLALGLFPAITGAWAIAAYVVGPVAFLTGLLGFCPAWAILGVNTCPVRQVPQVRQAQPK